jgi:circadian clock protein KaiC
LGRGRRFGFKHACDRPGWNREIAAYASVHRGGSTSGGGCPPLFVFDEQLGLLVARAKSMHIDLDGMRAKELLHIEQMDAAELSPGEFSHRVRAAVDRYISKVVVLDSLNGYQASIPEEQFLILLLHEVLQYLNRRGVATFLTIAQSGMMGDMRQPVNVTYLADTAIMLRYLEAFGRVRRASGRSDSRLGPTSRSSS